MKRILIAGFLASVVLCGATIAHAQSRGLCNSLLGRLIGSSQRVLVGFDEECFDIGTIVTDFTDSGCFSLLNAGELFSGHIAENGNDSDLVPVKECSALECCGLPVPPACTGFTDPTLCPQ